MAGIHFRKVDLSRTDQDLRRGAVFWRKQAVGGNLFDTIQSSGARIEYAVLARI